MSIEQLFTLIFLNCSSTFYFLHIVIRHTEISKSTCTCNFSKFTMHSLLQMITFHIFSQCATRIPFLSKPNQMDHVRFQQSIIKGAMGTQRWECPQRQEAEHCWSYERTAVSSFLWYHSKRRKKTLAVCYNANQGDYKRSRINTSFIWRGNVIIHSFNRWRPERW